MELKLKAGVEAQLPLIQRNHVLRALENYYEGPRSGMDWFHHKRLVNALCETPLTDEDKPMEDARPHPGPLPRGEGTEHAPRHD